jgi:hypothetical protein
MMPANPVLTLTAKGLGTYTEAVRLDGSCKGCLVIISIPAGNTGTLPTLTVTLNGLVPDLAVTPVYYLILATSALVASSALVSTLTVAPGAAVTANVSANNVVPQDLQISAVVGGTTPVVSATISVIGTL